MLGKVGVFNIIFGKNEHGDLLFYKLVEFSITIPAIYVNVKKICRKKENAENIFKKV